MGKHVILPALILALAPLALAQDSPNFAGPTRDNVFNETKWKKSFDGAPKVLWEKNVGPAFSNFTCVGDKVYTCGQQDNQQTVFCLDAKSGEVVWSKGIAPGFKDRMGGDGPRATPVIDEGRAYVVSATGAIVCLDANKGDVLWQKRLGRKPTWGFAGSVLIRGDLAIVVTGIKDAALTAYNKKDGVEVWHVGPGGAGYGTPYAFTFEGKPYLFAFMSDAFIIVNADTGAEAATQPWQTQYKVNAAAPVYQDGHLYVSSGYGTGAALYKLSGDGDRLALKEVWREKEPQNRFTTMVPYEGKLYGMSEQQFECVDFMTGKIEWQQPAKPWGNMILADGHLIALTADGTLQIAKATPDGFNPTATAKVLTGKCWTAPVLNRGRLYVRSLDTVKCIDLAE